jgi:hypothetical protein
MRFRRAIKGTCQAYCRPELSLGSQLAEVSEVLPTRPDQYSICAFRITEYSGNRLYATPEKEAHNEEQLDAFKSRLVKLEPIYFEHFVK